MTGTKETLRRILSRINGRGYKAYKDLEGEYSFPSFALYIDHVQGDPFAAPSKVRLRVPQSVAKLPPELFENRVRRIALSDYLARRVRQAIRQVVVGRRGSGKSGLVEIDAGGQEVLERTAVRITSDWVEARVFVGLPAAGRRILGGQAEEILCRELPEIVDQALCFENLPQEKVVGFIQCVENQEYIRAQLDSLGLVAFIGDGATLPRESGASDRPLPHDRAVSFQAPEALRIRLPVPHSIPGFGKEVSGMGIPKGVTLIVGGGYHGKSTLLRALERGVYPHIPGDGREYVVTCPDAVKIRAEDGRRVERVDISPFISALPYGRDTEAFTSDEASGSTSQAANILEALEVGAKLLLLDEDTSATNFMVRDARMQALVHKEDEPITPFLDRVRELYERFGVSTVLVMGGSGDYFDVADTVIMMRNYLPHVVTEKAKEIARTRPTDRRVEVKSPFSGVTPRVPLPESFDPSRGKRAVKIDAKALDLILYGRDPIELRFVEQLVDRSQTRAIGYAIHLAAQRFMNRQASLAEVLDQLEEFFDKYGLDALDPFRRGERHPGAFARPRRYEIAAAINRLRTLRIRPQTMKKAP